MTIQEIEKDLNTFKLKSKRLERINEWQNSLIRKAINSIITFLTFASFSIVAKIENGIVYSIVPAIVVLIAQIIVHFAKARIMNSLNK
jgi:hypothetical protein